MLKKFAVVLIIFAMVLPIFMPTVEAVGNVLNETEENVLYEQNENDILDNEEQNKEDINDNVTNFDVLLEGVLSELDVELMELSDVSSIILSKPDKTGVFIMEESRDYVVNLINTLTNKVYKVNEDGYLEVNEEATKDEELIKEEFDFYTDKIDELINTEKTVVLSIEDTYFLLNEVDSDIIQIRNEDDEFALLFKDSEEENNENDVIILNSNKYNIENTDNTNKYLLNKLLEVYYNEDEEFNNFINNQEMVDTNIEDEVTDEEIIDETIDEEVIDEDEEFTETYDFEQTIEEKEFNLVLAGILSDTVALDNIDEILVNKPTRDGIWIGPDSRETFLSFLNLHTIYTYSVDSEGYLVCDYVMKDNEYLDIIEKAETEVDIEINNILNKETLVIIDITNSYLAYEEDNIISKQLSSEYYTLGFDYDTSRIVLLNSSCYSDSSFNLALSDFLIKSLQNIQEKVLDGEIGFNKKYLSRSDVDKYGYMVSAQTVYHGPGSSDYATVGSVSSGEKVYILGKQNGWYHIQYIVTGSSNQKSGFVPTSTITNITGTPYEEQMTGGLKYAEFAIDVQSCDDFGISVKVGSVYAGEGVTVLYSYTFWSRLSCIIYRI